MNVKNKIKIAILTLSLAGCFNKKEEKINVKREKGYLKEHLKAEERAELNEIIKNGNIKRFEEFIDAHKEIVLNYPIIVKIMKTEMEPHDEEASAAETKFEFYGAIRRFIIKHGYDFETTKKILAMKGNIKLLGEKVEVTPLMAMAYYAPKIIAKNLNGVIGCGSTLVDVNQKNVNGLTALMFAAMSKDKIYASEAALHLSYAGANISEKDIRGETALMKAVVKGHIGVIVGLLGTGARIDEKDTRGETALMKAVVNGHEDIVAILLRRPSVRVRGRIDEKDIRGETALMKAVVNGHIEMAELLLKRGAIIDEKDIRGKTALIKAVVNGHTEIVKLLLNRGARIDERNLVGWTALMIAAWNGHTEIVDLLLKERARIDEKDIMGETALMKAAWNGHTEIVELLLKRGAKIDEKDIMGETALMKAVVNGHIEALKLLLKGRADTSERDIRGETVLMKAAVNGHIEVLELLLRIGKIIDDVNGEQCFFNRFVELTAEEMAYHTVVPIETLRKYYAYISERELVARRDIMDNTIIDNIIQRYLDKERLGELVYDIVSNMSIDDRKIEIDMNLFRILYDYIRYLNRKNATILMGQKINEEAAAINIIDRETIRGILNLTKSNQKEVIYRLKSLKLKWAEGKRDLIELKGMKEAVLDELFA